MSLQVKIKNNILGKNKRIKEKLKNLPKEAFKVFKDNTPVRSGNAKRKTRLSGNTIKAQYPYAEVLDKGRHMTSKGMRGSEQAPEGMTKPMEDFIRRRIKQILAGR
jgi:hypothetical protein